MKILIGYDGSVDADSALHDIELAGLPVKRFLLGSVSSAVASHAPCTVEVIRKHRSFRATRESRVSAYSAID